MCGIRSVVTAGSRMIVRALVRFVMSVMIGGLSVVRGVVWFLLIRMQMRMGICNESLLIGMRCAMAICAG